MESLTKTRTIQPREIDTLPAVLSDPMADTHLTPRFS